jgi:hypothetical protein
MIPQMPLYLLTNDKNLRQESSTQELSLEELSTVQGGILPLIIIGVLLLWPKKAY